MNEVLFFLLGVLIGAMILANGATNSCRENGYDDWEVDGCYSVIKE